jgi:Outer membrane protein beta-barrel domain
MVLPFDNQYFNTNLGFKPNYMKKAIILMIAITAFSGLKAQLQLGIKAGLNIASLSLTNVLGSGESKSSLTSFNGGLFASLPIAESLSVQPEINYSMQGTNLDLEGDKGSLNYDYLNIPVLIKYNHESGLFAETGPQAGFLLSAKAKSGGTSYDVKDGVQSFDFSWALGLGYKLHDLGLGIDVRYNFGLTNTIKDPFNGSSAKNGVFQIDLFYMFSPGSN